MNSIVSKLSGRINKYGYIKRDWCQDYIAEHRELWQLPEDVQAAKALKAWTQFRKNCWYRAKYGSVNGWYKSIHYRNVKKAYLDALELVALRDVHTDKDAEIQYDYKHTIRSPYMQDTPLFNYIIMKSGYSHSTYYLHGSLTSFIRKMFYHQFSTEIMSNTVSFPK